MAALPAVVLLASLRALWNLFSVSGQWDQRFSQSRALCLGWDTAPGWSWPSLVRDLANSSFYSFNFRVLPQFQEREACLATKCPLPQKKAIRHSMRTRHPLPWPPHKWLEGSRLPQLLPSLLLPWGARWKERWFRQRSQIRRCPVSHHAQHHKLLHLSRQMLPSTPCMRELDQEPGSSSVTLEKSFHLSEPFLLCLVPWMVLSQRLRKLHVIICACWQNCSFIRYKYQKYLPGKIAVII